MCGIVGYVGDKNAVTIIVDGLKRLSTAATIPRAWPCSTRTACRCGARRDV